MHVTGKLKNHRCPECGCGESDFRGRRRRQATVAVAAPITHTLSSVHGRSHRPINPAHYSNTTFTVTVSVTVAVVAKTVLVIIL